jgi:hypothetical protein
MMRLAAQFNTGCTNTIDMFAKRNICTYIHPHTHTHAHCTMQPLSAQASQKRAKTVQTMATQRIQLNTEWSQWINVEVAQGIPRHS